MYDDLRQLTFFDVSVFNKNWFLYFAKYGRNSLKRGAVHIRYIIIIEVI